MPPTEIFTSTPWVTQIMMSQKDGMELVYVPEGEFLMGSNEVDNEQPIHTVYLDAYWIDQTEVTNAMYEKCVEAGSCEKPSGLYFYEAGKYDDHPVVFVDWYQAEAYCEWAGRRLPSEAQWEKAARGDDGRTYPWGEGIDCGHAQYSGCDGNTILVGSLPSGASPYGALNMAGNVYEWVADWYDENYYENSPYENPQGPSSGGYRVLRGGSWGSDDMAVRSANRYSRTPSHTGNGHGFRCSRSAVSP